MTMAITTVENVRCYVDEQNTAWLNAEDVARGLGWVDYQEKVSATGCRKTYEVIRWATVNRYLKEFGFPRDVGKNDYIPENMFYRLAMKASNETAQWLHEVLGKQGKIYKRGRHIYMKAPFDREGYRTSETVTLERGKTVVNHYWTQKGRWFIYNTLKKIGIVPLDEREEKMATLL